MLTFRSWRGPVLSLLGSFALGAIACGSGDETSAAGPGAKGGTGGAAGSAGAAGAGAKVGTGSGGTKDQTGTGGSTQGTGGTQVGVGGASSTDGEVCTNGLDDNGNGKVDEGCPCAVGASQACFLGDPKVAGVGTCVKGVQTCEASGSAEFKGGSWGPCRNSVAPIAEVCGNAKDDDCDGAADDGCPCTEGSTVACQSICGKGVQTCQAGKLGACDAPLPVEEIPGNLKDDDCDGVIDETPSTCVAGAKEACTSICGSGTRVCLGGAFSACDAPQPSKEVAGNGKDDDCDGTIDEVCEKDATEACKTACGEGTRTCIAGAWGACSAKSPTAETCNGADDDCDGTVDNVLGLGGACCPDGVVCGTGTCTAGSLVCVATSPGAPVCQGAIGPISEVCGNGKDDDCDGTVDDGCPCSANDPPVPCSTACGAGTQTCAAGVLGACSARAPTVEICNGEDDDCDGTVDDLPGKGEACCPDGAPCGTGICTNGTRQCVTGTATLVCAGAVPPTAEACNALDDDCDGQVDEALCCDAGAACTTGLPGVCGPGKTACNGQCEPVTPASAEVCGNGIDEDCDGTPDDGCCVPATESCNGADDDCDGTVDEGCLCTDGQTQPCGFGCGNGTQTCVGGQWGACNAKQPAPETCNNLDDDCDGLVDENGVCCTLPVGTPCTVLGQTGACANGSWICPPGERLTGSCQQTVSASTETCNGRDDDCDGTVDEHPTCCVPQLGQACATGQAGICAAGTIQCSGQCLRDQDPRGEICGNGVDDDCNGQSEETCCAPNQGQGCATGEAGICGAGTVQCNGSCARNQGPASEICGNGVDEDCDGTADDGCCAPSCAGKICGADNGCGAPCAAGSGCCTPSCADKVCSDDDGCGGTCFKPGCRGCFSRVGPPGYTKGCPNPYPTWCCDPGDPFNGFPQTCIPGGLVNCP